MSLENWVLGIGGIIISLVTFVIGYRQTIGARQARVASANESLVEDLTRLLIVERKSISVADLVSSRSGKASDAGVAAASMRDEETLLDVLHFRVMSNKYVDAGAREAALTALEETRKGLRTGAPGRSLRNPLRPVLIAGLAVSAAGVGAAAVAFLASEGPQAETFDLWPVFALALLSTSGVAATFYSTSRRPTSRSLTSASLSLPDYHGYPPKEEGVAALAVLNQLSPFAVRNLYQLGEDEKRSVRIGAPVGLRGDLGRTVGLAELVALRLVRETAVPRGFKEGGAWYVLTPAGRAPAAILVAQVGISGQHDVPDYLIEFVHREATH